MINDIFSGIFSRPHKICDSVSVVANAPKLDPQIPLINRRDRFIPSATKQNTRIAIIDIQRVQLFERRQRVEHGLYTD